MRSPHAIGVPAPRPGTSILQRTFFVSLHSVGGCAVVETPLLAGPRHCGQKLSPGAAAAAALDIRTANAAMPKSTAAETNNRFDNRRRCDTKSSIVAHYAGTSVSVSLGPAWRSRRR